MGQAVGASRAAALTARHFAVFEPREFFFDLRRTPNNGQVLSVSELGGLCPSASNLSSRKFEHSNTFGLVTTASSNAVWARDDDIAGAVRRTGAGRAFVGASEEVLCWDVKKGELLGRWRDASCNAQVSTITHSKTDEDIFAVG